MVYIYYYHNEENLNISNGIIYMLSYYLKHNPNVDISINEFTDFKQFRDIENSPNSFVLLSAPFFELWWPIDNIIENLRIGNPYKKYNLLLGGGSILQYFPESILQFYPEIDHIKYGRGEVFLEKILNGGKEELNKYPQVINADNEKINSYEINPFFIQKYQKSGLIYLSYNGYKCFWNKCEFCCHVLPDGMINDSNQVYKQIKFYREKHNIKKFFIVDNYLIWKNFFNTLDLLLADGLNDIEFELHGAHINSNYKKITEYIPKFGSNFISDVGWGIEFLDDEILELYNKGTTVDKIMEHGKILNDIGVDLKAYTLLGLPMVGQKHIDNMWENLQKYDIYVKYYRNSFFTLDSFLNVYKDPEKFGIEIHSPTKLNIQFESRYPIMTKIYGFKTLNPDTGEMLLPVENRLRFKHIEDFMNLKRM